MNSILLCIAIDEDITLGNNEYLEDFSVNFIDNQTNVSENENQSSDILSVVTDPPNEGNIYIMWLYYNNLYSKIQLNISFLLLIPSYIYI